MQNENVEQLNTDEMVDAKEELSEETSLEPIQEEDEKEEQVKDKKTLRQEKIKRRIFEIDLIRGICIILMIFDHLMFDIFAYCPAFIGTVASYDGALAHMIDFAKWYWDWGVRVAIRYIVVFLFFMISGICSNFSKSNIKRGLITLAVAYALTIGTMFFSVYKVNGELFINPKNVIWFGVLHCLGYSMLITGVIQKFKADGKAPLFIWSVVIGVTGIVLMCLKTSFFDLAFGIVGSKMQMVGSNDFFPLFPFLAIFFFGAFLGKVLYEDRQSLFERGDVKFIKPIKFIGRHSIWFYLGHQGLFIGIIFLLQLIYL